MQAAVRQQKTTYTRADFMRLHFQTDGEHVGRVIGQLKRDGELRRYFVAPADKAAEEISRITDHPRFDYYIAANSFTGKDRNWENLFTLHNIAIDIDNHGTGNRKETERQIEAFLYFLREDLQGVPQPNSVVLTGRGVQLWWACEPLSGYNRGNVAKYEAVREAIVQALEELLAFPTLRGLEIDRGASHNAVGLFRLPGSYNTKTGRRGSFELWHEEPLDVMELARELAVEEIKKPGAKIQQLPQGGTASHALAKAREGALLSLLSLREREGEAVGEGLRDQFLFCLCCVWENVIPHDEILVKLDKLNRRFSCPLPDREWRGYMRSCERRKYKLSNRAIIERLEITETEQAAIGLYPGGSGKNNKRELERQAARERKAQRNAQIVELYAYDGLTAAQIAQRLDCSPATVGNVLQEAGLPTHREQLHARIVELLEYMGPSEAADELGVSVRTSRNHQQEAHNASQGLEPQQAGKLSTEQEECHQNDKTDATEAPAHGTETTTGAGVVFAALGKIIPFRVHSGEGGKEIQKTPLYKGGIWVPVLRTSPRDREKQRDGPGCP